MNELMMDHTPPIYAQQVSMLQKAQWKGLIPPNVHTPTLYTILPPNQMSLS